VPRAIGAVLYLAVFGSCIAYTAYFWLVREVSPALLGTYAYVNPAIAVLLGGALLGEQLGSSQILGALVILAAVVLVSAAARPPRNARQETAQECLTRAS
jgi:drug/metabolite transporter (DMT)-like permease